jgi:hypothetical protein
MKITKKNNKRIDHVQKGLKEDAKINPNRPLSEFTELVNLIGDQFDDDNTYTIKQEQLCLNQI